MKSFKKKIYLHRESEDNWDLIDKAEKLRIEYFNAKLKLRNENL